jgi:hypothetical protein
MKEPKLKRMMKFFKGLFQRSKPVRRFSNIRIYYGDKYEIDAAYRDLVHKEGTHITSVSITRVDNQGSRGYVDNYMIAVSYDYYA